MADPHSTEHSSSNPTAKEAGVVILTTIVISAAVMLLIAKMFTMGTSVDPDSPEMSEKAIAERIRPVGQVNVADAGSDDSATAGSSGQAAAPAEAPAAASASSGEQVYNASCQMCHGTGVGGAPIVGDKAVWKTRIAQGKDALYASAINGKNTMPPKGGAMSTSDDDIKAAVDFMIGKSG
jgi:cytochrome c5